MTIMNGVLMLDDKDYRSEPACCGSTKAGRLTVFETCDMELRHVLGAAGVKRLRRIAARHARARPVRGERLSSSCWPRRRPARGALRPRDEARAGSRAARRRPPRRARLDPGLPRLRPAPARAPGRRARHRGDRGAGAVRRRQPLRRRAGPRPRAEAGGGPHPAARHAPGARRLRGELRVRGRRRGGHPAGPLPRPAQRGGVRHQRERGRVRRPHHRRVRRHERGLAHRVDGARAARERGLVRRDRDPLPLAAVSVAAAGRGLGLQRLAGGPPQERGDAVDGVVAHGRGLQPRQPGGPAGRPGRAAAPRAQPGGEALRPRRVLAGGRGRRHPGARSGRRTSAWTRNGR